MRPHPLIEAAGLAAGYDGKAAITGVGFSLHEGERVALLGPNGGGKTTLMRTILGELPPLAGDLRVAVRCATVPQTERTVLGSAQCDRRRRRGLLQRGIESLQSMVDFRQIS